jgi:hypothetical protein
MSWIIENDENGRKNVEQKYKIFNDGLIDLTTGEKITDREVLKEIIREHKDELQDIQQLASELGISPKYIISTKKYGESRCVVIKDGYHHFVGYRVDLKNLFNQGNKLSIPSLAFIARFSPYILFPQNCLVINEKNPTTAVLWEELGVKKSTMYEILGELKKFDIIKMVRQGRENIIYFNPFLYCAGNVVLEETYQLFKDSSFNPYL